MSALSANPHTVLSLFDPDEQEAFWQDSGLTSKTLLDHRTASDLLVWIVQHRSDFILMAAEITRFLDRLEASIQGNIEFIVLNDQGVAIEVTFGRQLRQLVLAAETWVGQLTPDLQRAVSNLERSVRDFCSFAQPTSISRDSEVGAMYRRLADLGDPQAHIRRKKADMLRERGAGTCAADVRELHTLHEQLLGTRRTVAQFRDDDAGKRILMTFDRLVKDIHRKYEEFRFRKVDGRDAPRPILSGRGPQLTKQIREVEALIRQSNQLDQTMLEAMALALWKERWRIYELWVFCIVCAQLDRMGTMDANDRIINGRWALKFTNDTRPAVSFAVSDIWLDVYYQYSEKGTDRANMPDIAVRVRDTGNWVAVIDPKMVKDYRTASLTEVARRYQAAFTPKLSLIASYFPAEARAEEVSTDPAVVIDWGLRHRSAGLLHRSFDLALQRVGVCKIVAILVDVSASTTSVRARIKSSITATLDDQLRIDDVSSSVVTFNDRVVSHTSVADFLAGLGSPDDALPQAEGGTDFRCALDEARRLLTGRDGNREIWLFTDGDGLGPTQVNQLGVPIHVFVPVEAQTSEIQALCELSGGALHTL